MLFTMYLYIIHSLMETQQAGVGPVCHWCVVTRLHRDQACTTPGLSHTCTVESETLCDKTVTAC